jgi:hypothetical protein
MALHHQFMANGSQSVTLPNAWLADGDDITGLLQKRPTLEPFKLELPTGCATR